MDSGNSGSLQSSSGGDEEYDSRASDSVSAFISNPPPPPFFDPLPAYMQQQQLPNSSLLNSNLSWPNISARSDPNPITQEMLHSMLPNPIMPSFLSPTSGVGGVSGSPSAAPPRNPKKRSRASRRAPTTVLTTDTTNFRAMVQEFTGIPSPPFNSSAFPRSRLDLFGWRSDVAQPTPYLLRPLAQKIQPLHPFLASSTTIAASTSTINNSTTALAAASSSTPPSMVYQLPITNTSTLFNTTNQNILTSLLQSNPKFPFSTSPITTSKPQNLFENDHQTKIGGLDDQFGVGQNNQVSQTLEGLPNLIPSDHINNNAMSADADKHERINLREFNGSYDLQRNAMSGKMSFSVSSTSGFHGGKTPENAAAVRGEGMVESWLCSSE